ECFPLNAEVRLNDFTKWLDELESNDLIERYQIDDNKYVRMCRWRERKRGIDSKYPPSPNEAQPAGLGAGAVSIKKNKEARIDSWEAVASRFPATHQTEAFREKWAEWADYRRNTRHKPLSEKAIAKQARELGEVSHDNAIAAIDRAIASDWQGVFPKSGGSQQPGGGQPATRIEGRRISRRPNGPVCITAENVGSDGSTET